MPWPKARLWSWFGAPEHLTKGLGRALQRRCQQTVARTKFSFLDLQRFPEMDGKWMGNGRPHMALYRSIPKSQGVWENFNCWVSISGSGMRASIFLPSPKTGPEPEPWNPGTLQPRNLLFGCKAGLTNGCATKNQRSAGSYHVVIEFRSTSFISSFHMFPQYSALTCMQRKPSPSTTKSGWVSWRSAGISGCSLDQKLLPTPTKPGRTWVGPAMPCYALIAATKILHSWPSHSGNVENSAWPNTKRCLSKSPIFWVDSGWLSHGFPWIPKNIQKPVAATLGSPKFYSFHRATPHGQGHRLRPRSSPRAAQAPVDPFQRLHLSKKSRSQVRIGRPRSMEYGTYMELIYGIYIWNLYGIYIWNPYGIVELWPSSWWIFMFGMGWNGIEFSKNGTIYKT